MRRISRALLLSGPLVLIPLPAIAQPAAQSDGSAAAAPAPEPKKRASGPSLSIAPDVPQQGGRVASPAEPPPVVAAEPGADWKFDVTGYFRAPMRFSWGPAHDPGPEQPDGESGNAVSHPAPGAGRQLHRLAVHQQPGGAVDRAQLPLRQRPGEGDGPDRFVQHDRPRLPAAGVEPGHQPGVPHHFVAGARRSARTCISSPPSVVSRTGTELRGGTTAESTRPTSSAARTSRARP